MVVGTVTVIAVWLNELTGRLKDAPPATGVIVTVGIVAPNPAPAIVKGVDANVTIGSVTV